VSLSNPSPQEQEQQQLNTQLPHPDAHPYKLLMQGSAPYIAQNLGKTVVFHIPSDVIDNKSHDIAYPSKNIISDIAMTWMLGMKIVLVLGSSEQLQDHEQRQDAAAVLRTEVERRLNHCLYEAHGGPLADRQLEGNVICGNFYTAKRVGIAATSEQGHHHVIHHTGYAAHVDTERIHRVLHDNNDIVLLTSQGQGSKGQAISVDGHQLTASVATALNAYKVIYLSREGSVLSQEQSSSLDSSSRSQVIHQLPLSFAKSIAEYQNVCIRLGKAAAVGCGGPAHAIELMNNLVWASWAVENGVTSAHIVNPTDGAILEELFTSRNGSNICLYNDENVHSNVDGEDEDDVEEIFWEESTADDTSPAPTAATRMISSTAFTSKRHSSTNNRGQGKAGAFIRYKKRSRHSSVSSRSSPTTREHEFILIHRSNI
jgi:amino-acid N-acetyltransferase